MTVGLIVNPASGRSSGKGLELAHRLAGSRHVAVSVLDSFQGLRDALESLAAGGVETLFVSSGDGTVQAIQTELAERSPFAKPPRLALLAHGTTNMNADDVGFRHAGIPHIADLMQRPDLLRRSTAVKRRPTLRVVNPKGRSPQHGMFFGTGALWRATLITQRELNGAGIRGQLAPAITLAKAVATFLFVRPSPTDEERIDRPYPMDIFGDGVLNASGDQLLFLATTLGRLVLGATPFWGGAATPLRATAIAYPPPNVLRYIWPIMYGGEDIDVPEGCVSFSPRLIDIELATPFVIDGEFFEPPDGEPLRIEIGPEFEYLCG